jgi:phosphatidylglycerol:prolipoprotein diacylglycerol transferase
MLAGVFAAGIYVCRLCTKNGHDDSDGINFLLLTSIGVFVGGHILYSIVNYQIIIHVVKNISNIDSFKNFLSAVYLIFGGNIFYGGLLGGMLAVAIILKKRPQYRYLLDFVAPAVPLFHFFGRIGCFFAGCCFGIEASFGFTFRHSIIGEANGVSRFPVQLLEAFFNILLFFLLNYLLKKKIFENKLICVYLIIYATGRFLLEFLRGDAYRGIWLFLSTSQIISILIVFTVIFWLLYKRKSTASMCGG